jgi:putative N-acetylmannosamine-6-phosphate epimerase
MDYHKLSNRVLTLIGKYGSLITLSYFSPGTYSPVEGSYTSSTYTNIGVYGLFDTIEGYNGRQTRPTDIITTILQEKIDCICYIAASGITTPPTIADRITKMGETYEIVGKQRLRPAEISLLYTIFLRRG